MLNLINIKSRITALSIVLLFIGLSMSNAQATAPEVENFASKEVFTALDLSISVAGGDIERYLILPNSVFKSQLSYVAPDVKATYFGLFSDKLTKERDSTLEHDSIEHYNNLDTFHIPELYYYYNNIRDNDENAVFFGLNEIANATLYKAGDVRSLNDIAENVVILENGIDTDFVINKAVLISFTFDNYDSLETLLYSFNNPEGIVTTNWVTPHFKEKNSTSDESTIQYTSFQPLSDITDKIATIPKEISYFTSYTISDNNLFDNRMGIVSIISTPHSNVVLDTDITSEKVSNSQVSFFGSGVFYLIVFAVGGFVILTTYLNYKTSEYGSQ